MSELIIEADRLWRPEFAVINGYSINICLKTSLFRAEKIYENYSNFRAIISHKGMIRWEPGGVFKTMCTIDITYYPFDEQVRPIKHRS
ncbi:hypothetical protein LSH36_298g01072 [Paralvinella palmiformis]|uniref:Neurotransmitter-gated ion-channel ligand-binding domain-containing protein n=1 Tax=Paralvinella palmiformis TaxID=53620 RepID=A0AAD9JHQ5_9ANNE|nr:hypothetical protein LSH36_298g01072 [Paralvinella palmiformis]